MGGRLQNGYREKFRLLLARTHPARQVAGAERLLHLARRRSRHGGLPLSRCLAEVYEALRARRAPPPLDPRAVRFVCDAGLGGLARWLRAAGYEAEWDAAVEDAELVAQAGSRGAVAVTTDSGILQRRKVARQEVPVVWVPSNLRAPAQLEMVLRDLGLPLRAPRCMACGGELRPVSKEAVAARIPPRTARWKDEYFVCAGCQALFWKGTHWERIAARLRRAGKGLA